MAEDFSVCLMCLAIGLKATVCSAKIQCRLYDGTKKFNGNLYPEPNNHFKAIHSTQAKSQVYGWSAIDNILKQIGEDTYDRALNVD